MPPYKLSELRFAAPYFSAMDCVLNEEKAIYCSSELTSGFRLYGELRKHNLKSDKQLKKQLGDEWFTNNIWNMNVESANDFANTIRLANKESIVITPAPLKVHDWEQPDYTAFWDELIRTRVREVHFNKNWEYSNGCTAEMIGALDAKVPAFDSDGNLIDVDGAIARVEGGLQELQKYNLDTRKLEMNFHYLSSLKFQSLTVALGEIRQVEKEKVPIK
jgi:hypothetical protein